MSNKKGENKYYVSYTHARKEYPNSGTISNKTIKACSESAALTILKTFIKAGEILKNVKIKKL